MNFTRCPEPRQQPRYKSNSTPWRASLHWQQRTSYLYPIIEESTKNQSKRSAAKDASPFHQVEYRPFASRFGLVTTEFLSTYRCRDDSIPVGQVIQRFQPLLLGRTLSCGGEDSRRQALPPSRTNEDASSRRRAAHGTLRLHQGATRSDEWSSWASSAGCHAARRRRSLPTTTHRKLPVPTVNNRP